MSYATWTIMENEEYILSPNQGKTIEELQEDYGSQIIPAWSLVALLEVLEDASLEKDKEGWVACYYGEGWWRESTPHSNPIDSCVSLIETLYKQHLL